MIAAYDWNVDKIVDQWEDFGDIKSLSVSKKDVSEKNRTLTCGMSNGDIIFLKSDE
jgi:hypothetical protein